MTAEEIREATVYRIQKWGEHTYQIDKLIMDVEIEQYHITIKQLILDTLDLWCDCPGFRMQLYPKVEHKHIKIGLDFIERDEPKWAEYRINGTGKKAQIKFVKDSNT